MLEQAFNWSWGWMIAGAIIAGLEILFPGIFLVWIGLGAFAVGVVLTRYPELPLAWQMLVFAVSMVSSLSIGFWIQRHSDRSRDARFLNEELEAMVGQTYIANSRFVAGHGRIKVKDSSYAASSDSDIEAGELVEVVDIHDGRPKVAKTTGRTGRSG